MDFICGLMEKSSCAGSYILLIKFRAGNYGNLWKGRDGKNIMFHEFVPRDWFQS